MMKVFLLRKLPPQRTDSDKRYETSSGLHNLLSRFKKPTYLGHLVFGRMPQLVFGKPNYQYELMKANGKLENMHEPLVSQVFDKKE